MNFLTLLVSISAASTASTKETPYWAYVAVRSAAIRSAPSDDAYVTDRLDWGQKVEVHLKEDSEWCAIRPPEGSFSWIPKHAVRLTEDPSLGEIVRRDVKSQVGTRFEERRDVSHVNLSRGELVEILGQRHLKGKQDELRSWYMIFPPAGEFRWIRQNDLSVSPPNDVVPSRDAILPVFAGAENNSERPDVSASLTATLHARKSEYKVGPASYLQELVEPGTSPDYPEHAALVPRSSGKQFSSAATTDFDHSPSSTLRVEFSHVDRREVAKLELALSQTVLGAPREWRLKPIEQRVRFIIDSSRDAIARRDAQRILSKLIRFDDVRRRHFKLANRSAMALPSVLPKTEQAVIGSGLARQKNQDYAGRGYLMPVISQQSDTPKYALTDRNGQILQFVSGSPGVRLGTYERKEVAIIGQRSRRGHFGRPRLIADRVVELNRVRR